MSEFQGRFVWYELMTADIKAGADFYRSVVGWEIKDSGMPGPEYLICSAGETMVGGIMGQPEHVRAAGAPPAWLGYIAADDVDAMAERITGLGGKLHRGPDDIPTVGRFAVVADPQGAVFVLFHPLPPAGGSPECAPDATPQPGTAGWRELHASDPEAGLAFYQELFGWTRGEAIPMGELGTYQLFGLGERMMGGVMRKEPEAPHSFWLYYFIVPAIEAAETRVRAGGGVVLNGPMEVPGGDSILNCRDPQGGHFSLVGPKG